MSILSSASVNKDDNTEETAVEVEDAVDTGMSKEEMNAFVQEVERIVKLGEHDQRVALVQNKIKEKYRKINSIEAQYSRKEKIWGSTGAALGLIPSILFLIAAIDSSYFSEMHFIPVITTVLTILLMVPATGAGIGLSITEFFLKNSARTTKQIGEIYNEMNPLRLELVEKSLDAEILTKITNFNYDWQQVLAVKNGEIKEYIVRFRRNKTKGLEWVEERELVAK